jgi:uncharacterized CHY-type Zn-finger protein
VHIIPIFILPYGSWYIPLNVVIKGPQIVYQSVNKVGTISLCVCNYSVVSFRFSFATLELRRAVSAIQCHSDLHEEHPTEGITEDKRRYVVTTGDCGRRHYCITWRRYHGARHVTLTASVWYTRPQPILCGQWRNFLEPHSRRQVNRCPAKRQSRAAQHHKETQTVGTPRAGGFLRLSTVLHTRRIHFWLYLISLKILHEPSSWSLSGRPYCVQRRETNICSMSYRKRLIEWRVNENIIHIEERNVRHRLFLNRVQFCFTT